MIRIEAIPFPHPELVSDDDGDGIVASEDNCPTTANADQINRDGDRFGDACDPIDDRDSDSDGLVDLVDLCPRSIGGLEDIDGDRVGDDCDSDRDGDGVFNDDDTCPAVVNDGAAQSADIDDDGTGDACDADMDGDGVANAADSCPHKLNADQSDADGNGVGDACEPNLHGPVVADDLESLLWHNTDVPVTLTASDESHGVAAILYRIDEGDDVQTVEFPADPDPLRPVETTVTIPAAGNDGAHLLEYFGVDRGGLAGVPGSTTVRIDTIAPSIIAFRTPAGPNGWNTGDVTVTFLCSDQDLLSGVARCEPPRTLSADRAGQSVTGVADDRAGNRATTSVTDISIDGTPPTVTCPVTPTFPLGQPGATLVASIGDATSGPVTTEVSAPADTSSVGSKTATVTGEDLAGNRTTRACGYRVDYAFGGFEAPVDDFDANGNPVLNVVKAGRAIPLKWRLTDAAGDPVTTLTSAAITVVDVPCGLSITVDQIIETTAGDSGLQNFGDGSYQLNWKPPKDYGGSCKRLRLDLGEGNHRTAEFRFVE
jgi:hypothetical protein